MKSHCESCGRTDYETVDGYTICCNEPVCDGSNRAKYGVPNNYVIACCWGVAEEIFKEREQTIPEGSYRIGYC